MYRKVIAVLFLSSCLANENIGDLLLDEIKDKLFKGIVGNVQKELITHFLDNCTGIKKDLHLDRQPDTTHLYLDIWNDTGNKESIRLDEVPHKLKQSALYKETLPIVIFIHGFLSSSEGAASSKVVQELLIRGEHNVMALNSESLIKISYLISTNNVFYIGRQLGTALAGLNDTLGTIHIIGHSLGAHIAGFAGKTYLELTGNQISRITGLDPAGPCFFQEKPDDRLSHNDAKFVDAIHTDMGVYGYDHTIGDVDYFPNDGRNQPGCKTSYCSHSRSWQYFSESITSPKSFTALTCQNWVDFINGHCKGKPISYMGFETDPNSRGKYYLRTDEAPPFGKGDLGIQTNNIHTLLNWFKI